MSGPSLEKRDSHSSIHEMALNEARELTGLLKVLLKNHKVEKALEVAYILVEHWETRTLVHARSEEEGLYRKWAEVSGDLREQVIALTRDHELMRRIVAEIKGQLMRTKRALGTLEKFQALILIDSIHNEDEETRLA